jgi:glycosyltransferase involved in cell wall biosynthesis
MSKPVFIAPCLDFHIASSDAFRDLLVDPLADAADIRLTAWDGRTAPKNTGTNPLIYCMLPPPDELLRDKDLEAIWIPMWDQAQGYDDDWWSALPKGLRIVAFSDTVRAKASAAGLNVLRLRYYKDPDALPAAEWNQGNVLFYWNRVGMAGPDFIANACAALNVTTLLFKPDIDPRIEPNKSYELPEKLGATKVEIIRPTAKRQDFLRSIESANMVLSPRLTEGAGMVFLEAMARGCGVIAHDAPTMNEYITHGRNGILVANGYRSAGDTLRGKLGKPVERSHAPFLLSDYQPWRTIGRLDPAKLGGRARQDSIAGFAAWKESLRVYSEFITRR